MTGRAEPDVDACEPEQDERQGGAIVVAGRRWVGRAAQPCSRPALEALACDLQLGRRVALGHQAGRSKITRRLCLATRRSSAGKVNTTWKECVGSTRCIRPSIHLACASDWHLGQCRLRHELYDGSLYPQAAHTSTRYDRKASGASSRAWVNWAIFRVQRVL